jgi:hypothetical protein
MTITNGYLTQAEALAYVGQNLVQDTSLLDDVVTSSSRLIDRYCGREFFQVTEARTFATSDDIYSLQLGPFDDLVSVTTLKTDPTGAGVYSTTIGATAFQLLPYNAPQADEPYTSLQLLGGAQWPVPTFNMRQNTVEIMGVWGWPEVPFDVKQACRIIVAEISKMQESPLGVAGFGEFGVMRVSKTMPPRAMQLLAPYRHGRNFGIA